MTGPPAALKVCPWSAAQRQSLPSKTLSISTGCAASSSVFGLTSLYGLASILSFIAWLRDRKQRLLFWMAAYTFMPILELVLGGLRLPVSGIWLTWLIQTAIGIREICQWFLLLYLLQLDAYPRLARAVRIAAIVGLLRVFRRRPVVRDSFQYDSSPHSDC